MSFPLVALALWFAIDVLLLGGWLTLSARRKRVQARTMDRAAERYANLAISGNRVR